MEETGKKYASEVEDHNRECTKMDALVKALSGVNKIDHPRNVLRSYYKSYSDQVQSWPVVRLDDEDRTHYAIGALAMCRTLMNVCTRMEHELQELLRPAIRDNQSDQNVEDTDASESDDGAIVRDGAGAAAEAARNQPWCNATAGTEESGGAGQQDSEGERGTDDQEDH